MIGRNSFLVLIAFCTFAGCGDGNAVSKMIRDLSISPAADYSGVYGSVVEICARIEILEGRSERSLNYKALATRLSAFDFSDLNGNERVLVFCDYWRSIAVVCSKMATDSCLDEEAFALILNGWKKCSEMCDLSHERDAGVRREGEQKLHALFENDATLFERDILRLVFKNGNVSQTRQLKFYSMWHKVFGCRVEDHHANKIEGTCGASPSNDCR